MIICKCGSHTPSSAAPSTGVSAEYIAPLYLVTCDMHLSTSKNNTNPHIARYVYTVIPITMLLL